MVSGPRPDKILPAALDPLAGHPDDRAPGSDDGIAAWLTATVIAVLNGFLLSVRLRVEDEALRSESARSVE